jgi:hypothetical protein
MSPMAAHRNCSKNLSLSKHTDMTIHWKALQEHFLMVPLVSIQGDEFSEFFSKNLSLTLSGPRAHIGTVQLYTLPLDIQTDLESKPFDQLLNFWCLFYRKKTPLGSRLFFLLAKLSSLTITDMTIWHCASKWQYLIWTHFQTRRSCSFRDMGILRHVTCWEIVPK